MVLWPQSTILSSDHRVTLHGGLLVYRETFGILTTKQSISTSSLFHVFSVLCVIIVIVSYIFSTKFLSTGCVQEQVNSVGCVSFCKSYQQLATSGPPKIRQLLKIFTSGGPLPRN